MINDKWIVSQLDDYGFRVITEVPKTVDIQVFHYGGFPQRAKVFKSKGEALEHIKSLSEGKFHVFKYDAGVDVTKHISTTIKILCSDGTVTYDSKAWTG